MRFESTCLAALLTVALSPPANSQLLSPPSPRVGPEVRSLPIVRSNGASRDAAAITHTPGGTLIAWTTNDGTNDVLYAGRLRSNLEVDPGTVSVIRTAPKISSICMASDDESVLLWWEPPDQIMAARIDGQSKAIHGATLIGRTSQPPVNFPHGLEPELTIAGLTRRFAMATSWVTQIDVVAATPILGPGYFFTQFTVPLYATGDDVAIAKLWSQPPGGIAGHVTPGGLAMTVYWFMSGISVGPSLPASPIDDAAPSRLLCRRTDCIFVHARPVENSQAWFLAAAKVPYGDPSSVPGQPTVIALGIPRETGLAGACDRTSCLSVFTRNNGQQELWATFIEPTSVVSSSETLIASGNVSKPVAIASDDGQFLVVYEIANADGTRTIAGRMITTSSQPSRRRPSH